MCKELGDLRTIQDWASETRRLCATLYLLTQLIRVKSPELIGMQEAIMVLFASSMDDGGWGYKCGKGVNNLVEEFVGAVEERAQERDRQLAELLMGAPL